MEQARKFDRYCEDGYSYEELINGGLDFRKCLGLDCYVYFESSSNSHRICPECREKQEKIDQHRKSESASIRRPGKSSWRRFIK